MARFIMQDAAEAKKETPVVFSAEIDSDGDFNVSANGINIFYISKNTGQIHRYSLIDVDIMELKAAGLDIENDVLVVDGE